jgi:hypothetical protein
MTGLLEQEVRDALDVFIATITRAVEREAIATIRAAFARVPARVGRVPATRDRPAPSAVHAGLHLVERATGLTDVREQVIACIRRAPGSTTAELCRSLSMSGDSLRHHLRKLVGDGTVRFQERVTGFGGQRHRAYFMVEAPAVEPEPAAISAELRA